MNQTLDKSRPNINKNETNYKLYMQQASSIVT